MNKLFKLSKLLKKLGLKEEYISLSLLIKQSTPMEGVSPLKPNEPVNIFGDDDDDEEDEDGNLISKKIEIDETPREEIILRDKRQRNRLNISDKSVELQKWYDAFKEIGDSIILIPFDKEIVDKNEEILIGLSAVFGIPIASSYKEFHEKTNMLFGSSILGDVDKLKSFFPELWSNISRILSEKGLRQQDVVFMLYNQENSPVDRLAGFSKDPFFIGHDTHHNVNDSADSDYEFKLLIIEFIKNISKLYIIDDDDIDELSENDIKGKRNAYSEIENIDDDSEYEKHIGEFFYCPSGPEDSFADVFQQAASGTISLSIPDDLYFNETYILPEANIVKAEKIKDKFLYEIKQYMNSNAGESTRGRGPLSYYRGNVVLHDI